MTENESSNFRESANLVNILKSHLKNRKIQPGTEVFICIDNAVAEYTYFKGSSKSRKLHKRIVELRCLEMEGQLIVNFLQISGKRMISKGTDGLLRDNLSLGVLPTKVMWVYCNANNLQTSDACLKSRRHCQ